MSFTGSSVFDKFTFFGLLIPGLFASALTLPFVPGDWLTENVAWLVVFLLSFSFILGVMFHVFSEVLTKRLPVLDHPVSVFEGMVNEGEQVSKLPFSNTTVSAVDRAVLDACEDHLVAGGLLERSDDYSREEVASVYQYLLNYAWATGQNPTRIHLSIRMMCRSLMFVCLLFVVVGLAFAWDPLRLTDAYAPLYGDTFGNGSVLATYVAVLVVLAVGFLYGQHRYAVYLVKYTVADFVRVAGPAPTDTPADATDGDDTIAKADTAAETTE